jgi:hypothetical protein
MKRALRVDAAVKVMNADCFDVAAQPALEEAK